MTIIRVLMSGGDVAEMGAALFNAVHVTRPILLGLALFALSACGDARTAPAGTATTTAVPVTTTATTTADPVADYPHPISSRSVEFTDHGGICEVVEGAYPAPPKYRGRSYIAIVRVPFSRLWIATISRNRGLLCIHRFG